jgi:hypothetical protein
VADIFSLAAENVPKDELEKDNPALKNLHQGLEMTRDQLMKVFKRHGVELMEVCPHCRRRMPGRCTLSSITHIHVARASSSLIRAVMFARCLYITEKRASTFGRLCKATNFPFIPQPLGQKFDPNAHEALFQVDDPSKEPGTVAVVQKPGYTIGGRTLRAAVVGVIREQQ